MTSIVERPAIHGRSTAILIMGVAGLIFFGPITGIPGWIMANQDLRDVDTGYIDQSERPRLKTGKLLNILGTFCSPLWLVVLVATLGMLFFVLVSMAFSL